jgi:Photosynthetic reaction centre cytochrome C subunit.
MAAQSANAPEEQPPKNLKVLPKDLTTHQVREIMETWSDETGTECSTCHVRDATTPVLDGKAHYDYANDSKQEKRTARVMYEMTEQINSQFISKVPNSGVPVTCGNCHRGHLSPEPYNSETGK